MSVLLGVLGVCCVLIVVRCGLFFCLLIDACCVSFGVCRMLVVLCCLICGALLCVVWRLERVV